MIKQYLQEQNLQITDEQLSEIVNLILTAKRNKIKEMLKLENNYVETDNGLYLHKKFVEKLFKILLSD